MKNIALSIIVPVYNRPLEVDELLQSLTQQSYKNFEIVVVEDGSTIKCDEVLELYKNKLKIKYLFKENTGPGQSRNYGCINATGNYFIFVDSDCILPPNYLEIINNKLQQNYIDCFGGPDKDHESFSSLQKAINYAMTSFLTTGGIRGGSESLGKFSPRSFNMGFSKEVFEKTGGYSNMRFGEDIDMSIRILNNGFTTTLIKEAFVFHKRRTSLKQFFKQVFNSGIARINLYKRHSNSLKLFHFIPSLFIIGIFLLIVLSILVSKYMIIPLAIHSFIIFIDSTLKNKNINIGVISIVTSYSQFFGYGLGFLIAFWKRILFSRKEFSVFLNNFYE